MDIWKGRHSKLNLATHNARTSSYEASLAVLIEKLVGIYWDIIGLSEVGKTSEGYTVLKEIALTFSSNLNIFAMTS